jgi:hypothetical protein
VSPKHRKEFRPAQGVLRPTRRRRRSRSRPGDRWFGRPTPSGGPRSPPRTGQKVWQLAGGGAGFALIAIIFAFLPKSFGYLPVISTTPEGNQGKSITHLRRNGCKNTSTGAVEIVVPLAAPVPLARTINRELAEDDISPRADRHIATFCWLFYDSDKTEGGRPEGTIISTRPVVFHPTRTSAAWSRTCPPNRASASQEAKNGGNFIGRLKSVSEIFLTNFRTTV